MWGRNGDVTPQALPSGRGRIYFYKGQLNKNYNLQGLKLIPHYFIKILEGKYNFCFIWVK